jgi:nucleoid DNA-binding protein/cell division septation protein DedD
MKSLEDILIELLQKHECVVVPAFGGFIAKQKSAFVDFESGLIHPPFREIGFNIQLRSNDGLLVNQFATEYQLEYTASLDAVGQQVATWNEALRQGKQVSIPKIGNFKKDLEGNIQFEQDRSFNLLMSAYGLELVGFIPTKTVVNEGEKEVKNNRQLWKYAAAAAIAIPIAFYSIWIPVKTPALESGMFSYQDFNPFKTQNENTYTETQIDLPRIEHVSIETTYRDAYELHVNPKVAPHEPTITLIEPHVMYCIAGCFSSEENANRLVQKLEGLGFNCSILHEGSLYKVSLGHGFSEESVDSILNKAKSLNIQTWILK